MDPAPLSGVDTSLDVAANIAWILGDLTVELQPSAADKPTPWEMKKSAAWHREVGFTTDKLARSSCKLMQC